MNIEQIKEIKNVINENAGYAQCGIYDTKNTSGDDMVTLYSKNGITIDICYGYCYFEVFGVNEYDFENIKKYYYSCLLPEEWRSA